MEKSFAFSGKSPLLGYDALKDKHASFYFNSHPVKKHLRKLKKVTKSSSRPSIWNLTIQNLKHTLSNSPKKYNKWVMITYEVKYNLTNKPSNLHPFKNYNNFNVFSISPIQKKQIMIFLPSNKNLTIQDW